MSLMFARGSLAVVSGVVDPDSLPLTGEDEPPYERISAQGLPLVTVLPSFSLQNGCKRAELVSLQ